MAPSNVDANTTKEEKISDGFLRRFNDLVKLYGSNEEASEYCNVSAVSLGNYKRGLHSPSFSVVFALCRHKRVSLDWIATGEGSKYNQPVASEPTPIHPNLQRLVEKGVFDVLKPAEIDAVQRIASHPWAFHVVSRECGFAVPPRGIIPSRNEEVKSDQVVDALTFRIDWLDDTLKIDDRAVAVVVAKGDAMEPTIRSGDLLVIDTYEDRVTGDGLYLLKHDDHLEVRRIHRAMGQVIPVDRPESKDDERVFPLYVVKSDNPAYEPQKIPHDSLNRLGIIGRVRAVLRQT